MQLLIVDGKKVMDSRDIANVTKKRHDHVLRDIRSMQEQVKDATIFRGIYLDRYGRGYKTMREDLRSRSAEIRG